MVKKNRSARTNRSAAAAFLLLLSSPHSATAFAPCSSDGSSRKVLFQTATTLSSSSSSGSSSECGFRRRQHAIGNGSAKKRESAVAAEEYEALLQRRRLSLRSRSSSNNNSNKQNTPASTSDSVQEWSLDSSSSSSSSILPIVSAALLVTGNTVGAGCLVLPELAAGPGLGPVTAIFGAAWLVNLVSGLAIADVAIQQKESSSANGGGDGDDTPASFKQFAETNLNSPAAGAAVSAVSLLVNACVLAFDLSRAGVVGAALTGIDGSAVAAAWAGAAALLLTTQPAHRLSALSGACVAVLFASFAGLLLPGLAGVPDPLAVWAAPGTAPECYTCLAHVAPIILMSMQYQNIVPSVTKLLDYDRRHTAAAIALGSGLPLLMYVSWCLAGVGGGVDLTVATAGPLLTVFSLATLGGSSMGSSLSLAEELSPYFGGSTAAAAATTTAKQQQNEPPAAAAAALEAAVAEDSSSSSSDDSIVAKEPFQAAPVLAALSLPLAAALTWGHQEGGLTGALSLAGSFGSPLLYGVLPAVMAYQQRRHQQEQSPQQQGSNGNLVPGFSLPLLGGLATAFVGQEMVTRAGEFIALAT